MKKIYVLVISICGIIFISLILLIPRYVQNIKELSFKNEAKVDLNKVTKIFIRSGNNGDSIVIKDKDKVNNPKLNTKSHANIG